MGAQDFLGLKIVILSFHRNKQYVLIRIQQTYCRPSVVTRHKGEIERTQGTDSYCTVPQNITMTVLPSTIEQFIVYR